MAELIQLAQYGPLTPHPPPHRSKYYCYAAVLLLLLPLSLHYGVSTVQREFNGRNREKQCAPIFVRLAWHDAGTYDQTSGTGGPRGTIRFLPESGYAANAGYVC